MTPWFTRRSEDPDGPRDESRHNRRRVTRVERRIEALVLPGSGGAHAVEVRDVSATGLSFESASYLSRESEVTVKFSTAESEAAYFTASVRGRILWVRKSRTKKEACTCGLTFNPMTLPLHMALIRFFFDHYGLQFANPEDKRGGVRLTLGAATPMEAQTREGTPLKIHLRDISATGVRFTTEDFVDVRQVLSLTLAASDRTAIACEAMVVWVRRLKGNQAGSGLRPFLPQRARPDALGKIRYDVGARFRMLGEADKSRMVELLTRLGRPKDLEEREAPPTELKPWMPDYRERPTQQLPWIKGD